MARPPKRKEQSLVNNAERKRLRQIAHHLHPVVTIGEAGVTEAVIAETERALEDHELIKVKINAERQGRAELGERLLAAVRAEAVQSIGKVLVIYRSNPQAKPELSNVARANLPR